MTKPTAPGPFGPYCLIEELGEGGFGQVFRARPTGPTIVKSADVAVKIFKDPDDHGSVEWLFRRLKAEVEILASLNHDNIVRFHHRAEAEGRPYVEMELVDGPNLGELLKFLRSTKRLLPPPAIVEIALAICAALEVAHNAADGPPIVHRDLKPANVLLSPQGVPKLSDFGLAKGTKAGAASMSAVAGTANYMAPEQLLKRPVDARTDLYAFGVILAEAVLGEPLFPPDPSKAVEYAYTITTGLQGHLAHLNVQECVESRVRGLGSIVMKLLEPRPEDRFQSVLELERMLFESLERELLQSRRALRPLVREWLEVNRPVHDRALPLPMKGRTAVAPSVDGGGRLKRASRPIALAAGALVPLVLLEVLGFGLFPTANESVGEPRLELGGLGSAAVAPDPLGGEPVAGENENENEVEDKARSPSVDPRPPPLSLAKTVQGASNLKSWDKREVRFKSEFGSLLPPECTPSVVLGSGADIPPFPMESEDGARWTAVVDLSIVPAAIYKTSLPWAVSVPCCPEGPVAGLCEGIESQAVTVLELAG